MVQPFIFKPDFRFVSHILAAKFQKIRFSFFNLTALLITFDHKLANFSPIPMSICMPTHESKRQYIQDTSSYKIIFGQFLFGAKNCSLKFGHFCWSTA